MINIFVHFFAAIVKFKDYLLKLNKMKIGILANKGKLNDFDFRSLKIISRNLAPPPQKKRNPQIKTNEVIISSNQETCNV